MLHKHTQAQNIIFQVYTTFLGLAKWWKSISAARTKPRNSCNFFIINIIIIRVWGRTLYVRLQHVVPPTNTKFKPLFSRLKRVYHTQTFTSTEHHISSLHSHFWFQSTGSPFLPTDKNWKFLWFLHHNNNSNNNNIKKIVSIISSDEISLSSAHKICINRKLFSWSTCFWHSYHIYWSI